MTIEISAHKSRLRGGFTLAEALIAVVVLGIAAAGVILPFSSGAAVRAEGLRRTMAAGLACDLIEKIVNTPFDDIVSTYDGYSESEGQVKDATGAVFTDPKYARFSRSASCVSAYVPQESALVEPQFVLASAQVCYAGRQLAVVNRLICR
jgi:prepilin-type N-terminal cleavage/methylation domain-containing protein